MKNITRPAPRPFATLASIALITTLSMAGSAQAELLDTVSVSLVAPNILDAALTQAAPLATGILAGNLGGTGDISTAMLDDEQITFEGDSILLRVASDGSSASTGWGTGARYELTGITVVDRLITGVAVFAWDGYGATGSFSGLASPAAVALVNLSGTPSLRSITFTLDDSLQFVDRGNGPIYNYAEFRIDLLSQPVPEPGQWLLMAAGLASLGLLAARRRRGPR